MRKMMWWTLGAAASCAVGAYLAFGDYMIIFALCVCAAILILGRKHKQLLAVAVMLFGFACGMGWFSFFDSMYLENARKLDGQNRELVIEVSDFSYETEFGVATDGLLRLEGRTYRIRAYVNSFQQMYPGDVLDGTFRLRFTSTGSLEEETYHQDRGIFLLAYPVGDILIEAAEEIPDIYAVEEFRQYLLELIDRIFPADTAPFARALLLGDSSLIDYETDTAFKLSGIRHIIAVSGLHVSIVFSVIYTFTGKRRILTSLFGIPLVILFAAVAGFTASVVRACVMQILMMLALLFNKEYDPPTALAFSALVMLGINPLVITGIGFQLSVGCMAGIFLFSERIKAYLLHKDRLGEGKGKTLKARCARWLAGSASVSLSAVVFTTPLSAVYFGTVSLVGVVTNLLTLSVTTFSFYGVMVACALGAVFPVAGQVLAGAASYGLRYIMGVSKALAAFPLAAVYTKSIFIVAWIVLIYALLVIYLKWKKIGPGTLCCTGVIALCIALLLSWSVPILGNYRMTAINVGQGQCLILQSGERVFVVDCGGNNAKIAADEAAQTLLSRGIHRIDGLIITHYDYDHAGGAVHLLSQIQADNVYLPKQKEDLPICAALWSYNGGRIYEIKQDIQLDLESTKISIFASDMEESGNESSLCVLFQAENCDILITGDRNTLGERLLMEKTNLPDLEVLVVGHHGSKNSTSELLLQQTRPDIAVISVAANNVYGHPTQEVLDRLEAAGCYITRTDQDGTIIIRG